jgi:serine/threonine protein kinase
LIHPKTRAIKLIDFGSATRIPQDPYNQTCNLFYGTKKFASPEAVRGDPYCPDAQESWTLGSLLFVLLFKLDPFSSDDEILNVDIGKRIAKFQNAALAKHGGTGKAFISDNAVEALRWMLEKDPADRLHVVDILDLSLFS